MAHSYLIDTSNQYAIILLLALACPGAEAFFNAPIAKTFPFDSSMPPRHRERLTAFDMSVEIESKSFQPSLPLESIVPEHLVSTQSDSMEYNFDINTAEREHEMPWTSSVGGADAPLLYMPFWEWQLSFMKENLTNLHVLSCTPEASVSYPTSSKDFSYNENQKKKARIVNLCFASDEYRKIRLTYYDAGEGCQVFNSVFYPHEESNLPILGIDILSFNRKKYLAIVDFQPLYQEEDRHSVTYEESILKPIREDYPSLKGKMSSKFYDETQFFSRQMLFSRFEREEIIMNELFPAFQRYVQSHLDLVRNTESSIQNVDAVTGRQVAYDSYSAERDPATGLFAAMFGKEWADEYVHGFLFSRSDKSESVAPSHSGPPGAKKGSHQ